MATTLNTADILALASIVASKGSSMFDDTTVLTFKCNVGDVLDIEGDFATALDARASGVNVATLHSAVLTPAAKKQRTAIMGAFKRAACKVNGDNASFTLTTANVVNRDKDGEPITDKDGNVTFTARLAVKRMK